MTIEVALIISAISLAFWIYSGVANLKRNSKNDTKTDTAQCNSGAHIAGRLDAGRGGEPV